MELFSRLEVQSSTPSDCSPLGLMVQSFWPNGGVLLAWWHSPQSLVIPSSRLSGAVLSGLVVQSSWPSDAVLRAIWCSPLGLMVQCSSPDGALLSARGAVLYA
jgi:hypothetical protein